VDCLFRASARDRRRVTIAHFDGCRSHTEVMKLRTIDGRLLDVQLAVTFPTPPEQLDVTVISLDDLTDRLRTEAQLRQLRPISHAPPASRPSVSSRPRSRMR